MLVWAAGLHGSSATQLLPWPGAGLCCTVSLDMVVILDTVSHMQQYTFVFPPVLYNHLWQWPCSNFDQRNKTNLLRCIECRQTRESSSSSSCKWIYKLLFVCWRWWYNAEGGRRLYIFVCVSVGNPGLQWWPSISLAGPGLVHIW